MFVSTLTGAFGQSLRETRLTAMLGYLISRAPEDFLPLFGFAGTPLRVALETHHEGGRSDILIETNRGTGIVEAKINAADPLNQSHRYPGRWRALLTHRLAPHTNRKDVRYVSWEQIGQLLRTLGHSASFEVRLLSSDLHRYLQEKLMIRNQTPFDIYAREINNQPTLALFLKGHMYGCRYEPNSPLQEARYFAPHFGNRISEQLPGVSAGISYVAQITTVGTANTWREFRELVFENRGRRWWASHRANMDEIHRHWTWGREQRSFLFLHEPRLVFNPPVHKKNLQNNRAFLARRFFSFDQLFAAWGK